MKAIFSLVVLLLVMMEIIVEGRASPSSFSSALRRRAQQYPYEQVAPGMEEEEQLMAAVAVIEDHDRDDVQELLPVHLPNTTDVHLFDWDQIRQRDPSASRAGIVDKITVLNQTLGLCHIPTFTAFSRLDANGTREPYAFQDQSVAGFAGVQLALDMLNKGDGSVIREIQGLNATCRIRFTSEAKDSGLHPFYTVRQVNDILARQTPQQREACAFLGAARSAVTIPMAIMTGLAGRPQLSPWSTSSQLDDVETFPLFGRLITSELGVVLPLIQYFKDKGVKHVGVVHWDDEYGNDYMKSLLLTAADMHPELQLVSVQIPSAGASDQDYTVAVDFLAKTQFRWFFALLGVAQDYAPIMTKAWDKGIATGDHVWILNSYAGAAYFQSLVLPKDSPLAMATQGVALFSAQNGRPGMRVFDKFAARLQALANPQDMEFVDKRLPRYPDEPEFNRSFVSNETFVQDPSVYAATLFDETIVLGLAACKAAAHSPDGITVEGKIMFEYIHNTSFEGATGNVTLDPFTNSRLPSTAVFRITNIVKRAVNETHITFETVDTDVYMDGQWVEEVPFIYNDEGSTVVPLDLPPYATNYYYIGTMLRVIGLVMAGLVMLASIGFATWTVQQRNAHVVRASQPIFLVTITIGTFIMSSAIIPLSIDDQVASQEGCNAACMTAPWLGFVGFALIFAALFSKTWRIVRLFSHPTMHRIKISALDVVIPLILLMTANLIVLSVWTAVSPLEWGREVTMVGPFGRPLESRGRCTSDGALPFFIILVFLDVGALVLAAYQAYQARGIATEFAESDHIGRAIGCMVLVASVGLPTIIIVSDDYKVQYFLLSCIIFVLCAATLLFIFVPKIKLACQVQTADIRQSIRRSVVRTSVIPGVGASGFPTSASTDFSLEMSDLDGGVKILNKPQYVQDMAKENARLKKGVNDLQQQIAELRALLPGRGAVESSITISDGLQLESSEMKS